MAKPDAPDDLEIYGTTTIPQEDLLPFRLSPVYRCRSDGTFFLPGDDEGTDLTCLLPASADWINEQESMSELLVFDTPLRARQGCWLLQLESQALPEVLSPEEGKKRLEEVGHTALREVEDAIRRGDRALAERRAWYASRALPEEALPLVVLIHLLRQAGLPQDEIAVLEKDAHRLPREKCASAQETLESWLNRRPRTSGAIQSRFPHIAERPDWPSLQNWIAEIRAAGQFLRPSRVSG